MRVLLTGGTGLIGTSVTSALQDHGHTVRILARGETEAPPRAGHEVEFHKGDVSDAGSIRGAAEACDAVVHLAGIVRDDPPDQTLERVNVEGTRNMLDEARRAGVKRFVFVSSLGAERGESEYHQSKFHAEEAVRGFPGEWTILRPGNVYGPGVGTIALFLRLVRTLPVVPAVGDADQRFQPIWVGDLAEAVARVLRRDDLAGKALDLAGLESTSQRELFEHFCELTSRSPSLVVLPRTLVSTGARLLQAVHLTPPISEDQVTMLEEGNLLPEGRSNALRDVLHIAPLPLRDGLALVAYAAPEQLPSEGAGTFVRRRVWAEVEGSTWTPQQAIDVIQRDFEELIPNVAAVAGAEETSPRLAPGATITLRLRLRGNVQIRVEEVTDCSITCITLKGHPLAGAVRFLAEERGRRLRFEVQTFDRPANVFDGIAMATLGLSLKRYTWSRVVEALVERSGGEAPDGVESTEDALDTDQAEHVEEWLRQLVGAREERREGPPTGARPPSSMRS